MKIQPTLRKIKAIRVPTKRKLNYLMSIHHSVFDIINSPHLKLSQAEQDYLVYKSTKDA